MQEHRNPRFPAAPHWPDDRIVRLINDILDFSKIEAGKLEFAEEDFSFQASLSGIMKTLAIRAHQKGLELSYQIASDVPNGLRGDSGRLEQVLINLIGNAIKFTESGEVTVGVVADPCAEGPLLHFRVQDTGPGISPEQQQRIFEPFTQADGSTSRRYGGTGLGLTISVRLVERMGGRIWVESEPGRGSTFHFTARFGPAQTPEIGLLPEPPVKLQDLPVLVVDDTRLQQPLRILLAEDNPINQLVAVRMLEKFGHTVVTASDGKEAIVQWEQQPFDLVLMDVQMPDMDGFAATRVIRDKERETGSHLPIIALTAHALKGDRERCLAAGMDGYLCKPIKGEKLRQAIAEQFSS